MLHHLAVGRRSATAWSARTLASIPVGRPTAEQALDALRSEGHDGVGRWDAHCAVPNAWVDELELDGCRALGAAKFGEMNRPRVLLLYGSLRQRSFSKMLALECARILELLDCDVRVFDPRGLPVRDPALESHPKVRELRALSEWSEGQVWAAPEIHGGASGAFKNLIDWIPLSTGSVRPTQGRVAAVLQVCGGSQSFNAVNELRRLARWMRMPCVTNQSAVAKAWLEFDEADRMKPSAYRDRVVDVMEETFKWVVLLRGEATFLNDRYSEREETRREGRLLSQAEKAAQ